MTDTLTGMLSEDDFLEHYGVKGMKWGVLRDQAAAGNRGAQKQLDKADQKMLKELNSTAGFIKVHNGIADKMNNGLIEKFNADPKYSKIKDFTDESDPKVQGYFNDYAKLTSKVQLEVVKELYGESPSGKYVMEYKKDADGNDYLDFKGDKAGTLSHADGDISVRFYVAKAPNGRILGLKAIDDKGEVKHTNQRGSNMSDTMTGMMSEADFIQHAKDVEEMSDEEYLEHYGVKGMKWGRRMAEINLGVAAKARTSTGNDKSRKEGREERNAAIDAARGRVHSGQNKAAYKEAKAAYKAEKHTAGRAAAKDALREVRSKNKDDFHDSRLAKSGGEAAAVAVLAVASIALSALR